MAKKHPKTPRPKKDPRKTGSKLMAAVLVLAMALPMGASLIGLGINGIRDLALSAAGLSDDAQWLMELLVGSGCPEKAAKAIAITAQEKDWLPAASVYYIPEDETGTTGSAVMNTDRHMVSAAVQDGGLYAMQVTDQYQNESLLAQAGLDGEQARDAAEWLFDQDAGLLSDAEPDGSGGIVLSLPDGTKTLSGDTGNWVLADYTQKEEDGDGKTEDEQAGGNAEEK